MNGNFSEAGTFFFLQDCMAKEEEIHVCNFGAFPTFNKKLEVNQVPEYLYWHLMIKEVCCTPNYLKATYLGKL